MSCDDVMTLEQMSRTAAAAVAAAARWRHAFAHLLAVCEKHWCGSRRDVSKGRTIPVEVMLFPRLALKLELAQKLVHRRALRIYAHASVSSHLRNAATCAVCTSWM